MSARKIDEGDEIHVYISVSDVGDYLNRYEDKYDEEDCAEALAGYIEEELREEFSDFSVYVTHYQTSFASAGIPVNVMLDNDSPYTDLREELTESISETVSRLFTEWCNESDAEVI